jgi:hypothetical protein
MRNRHPADELADIRAEVRRLETHANTLRAYLLENPDDRVGDDYIADASIRQYRRVDLDALADEVGEDVVEQFATYRESPLIRTRKRRPARRRRLSQK